MWLSSRSLTITLTAANSNPIAKDTKVKSDAALLGLDSDWHNFTFSTAIVCRRLK